MSAVNTRKASRFANASTKESAERYQALTMAHQARGSVPYSLIGQLVQHDMIPPLSLPIRHGEFLYPDLHLKLSFGFLHKLLVTLKLNVSSLIATKICNCPYIFRVTADSRDNSGSW